MASEDPIKKILESRRQGSATAPPPQEEGDKFFSLLIGEGLVENFLEFRFRAGMRTCFAYSDLSWFNFDPEAGMLDLEFGGYLITLKGRGFGDRLFDGIKQKRVAWIKEADVEMQDHVANSVFIEQILITPPSSGSETEVEAES